MKLLFKARRIIDTKEIYQPMAGILQSLTRDHNKRPRDLRPGEKAETLWDELDSGKWKFKVGKAHKTDGLAGFETSKLPFGFAYSEADALEDAILFPEELTNPDAKLPVQEAANSLDKWESTGPKLRKFCLDLDSDESDEYSDEGFDEYDDEGDAAEDEDYSDMTSDMDGDEEILSNEGEFVLEEEVERQRRVDDKLSSLTKVNPDITPDELWATVPEDSITIRWDTGYANIFIRLMPYLAQPEKAPEFLKNDPIFKWYQKWNKRMQNLDSKRQMSSNPLDSEFMDFLHRDKSHGKLLGSHDSQALTVCSF
jgi:hypothetical protein